MNGQSFGIVKTENVLRPSVVRLVRQFTPTNGRMDDGREQVNNLMGKYLGIGKMENDGRMDDMRNSKKEI